MDTATLRLTPLLLLFMIGGLTAAPLTTVAQSSPDGSFQESDMPISSMEEAFSSAEAEGKAVYIDVYAPWCPHCQRLEEEVYADDEVQELMHEHFVMVRLNADDPEEEHVFEGETYTAPELANAFGAHGFPTLIFMDHNAERIGALPGAVDREDFMLLINYVGTGAYQNQTLDDFADE